MFPSRLERKHPFRQWKTWTMPVGLTLTGYSRANDKTFFHVPELKLALDAGLVEGRQVDTVLLTHTHLDHSKDLDFLATRSTGVDIYTPAQAADYVRDYLRATTALNQTAPFRLAQAGGVRVHGIPPEEEFTIGKGGAHTVRVLATEHKVPSVGYCVAENRRTLMPEYASLKERLSPAEFGRLLARDRADGREVARPVQRPLFAYLGDTHADALLRAPWLTDYPVIITECTYLDDAELDRARRVGHTVWSELRPFVAAHPDNLFVLTHFSLRHSEADVVAFFEQEDLATAELPYAREEQRERAGEFAPDPAPLLAGEYSYFLGRWTGWPTRHYLGEPVEVTYDQECDETMLLGCTCGVSECWALLARIEVTAAEVRWSGFRNNSRDWDLSATLGPFVFARRQYEAALRATAPPPLRSSAGHR